MRFCIFLLSAFLLVACGNKEKKAENEFKSGDKSGLGSERLNAAEIELVQSVKANDPETLRRILFENTFLNLNKRTENGDTLLSYAVKMKFVLIRNILLKEGANPDVVSVSDDYNGQTPLMIAAGIGDMGSILALLDANAGLNNQDWDGNTALHKAIEMGHEPSARALIYAGANLVVKNDRQESVLDTAIRSQNLELADYIRGLVNMQLGTTSIAVFRKILVDADIVNYRRLVTNYPAVIKEYEVINPLVISIEAQNDLKSFEIAQSLLALKLSPNGPAGATELPLGRAVQLQKKNFIELLLRYKANINATDAEGHPPLYFAIMNNDEWMVDFLMYNGAREKLPGFKACKVADAVQKKLTTQEEQSRNKRIQSRLDCFWTR